MKVILFDGKKKGLKDKNVIETEEVDVIVSSFAEKL